jgi:glycosyltransferase involved in cell wall biosynthesis
MRIVTFGTYDARIHPRAAVLVDGLEGGGFEIHEINAPLGLGTADRVGILQNPRRLPLLVGRIVSRWATLLRRSLRVGRPDAVLVPYMGHFDVLLARLRWPRTTIVLDYLVSAAGTARDRGERAGPKLLVLRFLDSLATRTADVVVVDTEESATRLPARTRRRTVVVPVGATQGWYDARLTANPTATNGPLRVVFFGSFTPLQGTATIARAIARIDEGLLAVTMVGGGQDQAEVRRILGDRADLTWHEWVPVEQLAHLVAGHDVCLGIFGASDKAVTVVPTKIYQGAAAGCAIVTSDTPPQRRLLEGAAVLVLPADDAALADALRALAADRTEVRRLRAAAADRARSFTPPLCVASLAAVLES